MWWWWVFTFMHINCVSIFWFIARNIENPKMSFNGQPNISKIISCTCLHLKLDILNPLNIIFCQIIKKVNLLPWSFLFQNFKTLKILYDLVFHQVHPMNIYFHRRGHIVVVQKVWYQLYDFMHSFWFLFF
jgi:hypothetical protein